MYHAEIELGWDSTYTAAGHRQLVEGIGDSPHGLQLTGRWACSRQAGWEQREAAAETGVKPMRPT